MLIVHVVTLVTPDSAYGGPVRVAVNQLKELAARGHEVLMIGGHRGYGSRIPPTMMDGVPTRLFPVRRIAPKSGFVGLISPGLTRWLHRQAPTIGIAHVHLSRDLIPLTAAHVLQRNKVPTVVQTHGMVVPSQHLLARPLDAVFTRRLLAGAAAVFYLIPAEKESLLQVARSPISLVLLPNGVPMPPGRNLAATDDSGPEVLFMARLHPRKRPDVFVRAAIELAMEFPAARFSLVGPDEGMGSDVEQLIDRSGLEKRIVWEGPIDPDKSLRRLKQAAIYALPSVVENFPMAVLEALSVGRPVVVTDTCGLASDIADGRAGLVVGPSQDNFTASLRTLLQDEQLRASMGENARALAIERFAMSPVVDTLLGSYEQASLTRSHG